MNAADLQTKLKKSKTKNQKPKHMLAPIIMKRALIVDDEENARLYLARMIAVTYADMEIQFAGTPSEALFVLEKFRPDVLFLDVEMSGMSGLELLKAIREKRPELPVVIVSGYYEFDYVKKALRLNAVDYLNKPVDPDELEQAIRKALLKETVIPEPVENEAKISLSTDKGMLYVVPSQVLYFATNKRTSFVYLVNNEKPVLVRESLTILEKMLSVNDFLRVSRQYIVNKNHIRYVNRSRYIILQAGGREVRLDKINSHIINDFMK